MPRLQACYWHCKLFWVDGYNGCYKWYVIAGHVVKREYLTKTASMRQWSYRNYIHAMMFSQTTKHCVEITAWQCGFFCRSVVTSDVIIITERTRNYCLDFSVKSFVQHFHKTLWIIKHFAAFTACIACTHIALCAKHHARHHATHIQKSYSVLGRWFQNRRIGHKHNATVRPKCFMHRWIRLWQLAWEIM